MDYVSILQYLLPGIEWTCGTTYESIVILTPNIPAPTQDQCNAAWLVIQNDTLISTYGAAMQNLIDTAAQTKNYMNGYAVASYVMSTNTTWAAEAVTFISWRDACWAYAYQVEAAAQQDPSTLPPLDQFVANAPKLNWV